MLPTSKPSTYPATPVRIAAVFSYISNYFHEIIYRSPGECVLYCYGEKKVLPLLLRMLIDDSLPQFDYNVEPQCLRFNPDIPVVEGALINDNLMDSVRHIQLGKQPAALRRCTRCGAWSSLSSVARTAAMRAWEQRWASGCRCGGFWRLQILT